MTAEAVDVALAAPGQAMAADMAEQPAVIALLAERRDWAATIPLPRGFVIVGRGTSANAAEFGRLLFDRVLHRPAIALAPGPVGTTYQGWMAVGISQSGRTPGVAPTLRALAHAGASTVALTNDGRSPLARSADAVVLLETGPERAVPATKTFTASLVALLLLAGVKVDGLPEALSDLLADPIAVDPELAALEGWACIGDGLLEPMAAEAALKLEEAALTVADHHSPASFQHGPIATAGPRRPALLLGTDRAMAMTLRALGSPVVMPTLPDLPEPLLAVAAAVRAQQFALALALARGLDPDCPPGLHKVTLA